MKNFVLEHEGMDAVGGFKAKSLLDAITQLFSGWFVNKDSKVWRMERLGITKVRVTVDGVNYILREIDGYGALATEQMINIGET